MLLYLKACFKKYITLCIKIMKHKYTSIYLKPSMKISRLMFYLLLCFIMLPLSVFAQAVDQLHTNILIQSGNSFHEKMASKELRRYIYLRSGILSSIIEHNINKNVKATIIMGVKNQPYLKPYIDAAKISDRVALLEAQQYTIKTIDVNGSKAILIVGGDALGLLYGTYTFVEQLGVRFYLEGDVIPDKKMLWAIPEIDEDGKPLFQLRGLNPWGSHPFGFDQWNTDDYKAIIGQMLKLKMNFIGMHNYLTNPYNEPTVWVGEKENINANGTVKYAYPARYYSTTWRGIWGPILPKKTTEYSFGAAMLFETDSWGPETMKDFTPTPYKKEDQHELFNRVGKQFNEAFSFAKLVGVKTALGTEAPLSKFVPIEVKKEFEQNNKTTNKKTFINEIYKGIFERIKRTHPLDYYWLWTPEDWTWNANSINDMQETVEDVNIAYQAAEAVNAPFTLATSGWVLGPVADRSAFDAAIPKNIPMSALNRNMGHVGVDPAFKNINGREKWAMPWLESDGIQGLGALQLFAGRSMFDAVAAKKLACTGLMGLMWRTRELGPNVAALSQTAWDWKTYNNNDSIDYNIDKEVGPLSSRHLPVQDFYKDFATINFGSSMSEPIAKIFASLDGNVPVSVAMNCPTGSLTPYNRTQELVKIAPNGVVDAMTWEKISMDYGFVEEMEKLRTGVKGAGNIERFDFWLNTFRYHKQLAKLRWQLESFETTIKNVKNQAGYEAQRAFAMREALPLYIKLVNEYETLVGYQLKLITTNSGIANVVNLMQHKDYWEMIIETPAKSLVEVIGEDLPLEAIPSKVYKGKSRMFMTTVKTSIFDTEPLLIKVNTLSASKPSKIVMHWRPIGTGAYTKIALKQIKNGIYSTTLGVDKIVGKDIEYYIEATYNDGTIFYPATAKEVNNSVIVLKK